MYVVRTCKPFFFGRHLHNKRGCLTALVISYSMRAPDLFSDSLADRGRVPIVKGIGGCYRGLIRKCFCEDCRQRGLPLNSQIFLEVNEEFEGLWRNLKGFGSILGGK